MLVLDQVTESWQNQRDVLQSLSESVQQLTQQTTSIFDATNPLPSVSVLKKAIEQAEELFDAEWGGFGRPPKFPMSVRLQFLMRMYLRIPDKRISDMVEKTLQSMAWGGLYDHLGGGFARYSTDRQWLIPHFEKMLYDNALLAQTYVEAFLLTKNPTYASIAKETLHYVLNRMENKELGGFYSAEDADSEGKEGKFYVWTNAQLQSLLTAEEFELVRAVYGVTRDGNFEHGTTHLSLQKNYKWEDKQQPLLRSAHEKLFRAREQRIHPLRDDKQLVSWNALMIKAMATAAQAFNEEHERDDKKAFLEAAQRAARFIRDKLYNSETGTLYRRYIDGDVRYEGTLDDYAYLISALLTLYQTDWNASWLKWAIELQRYQDDFFWDKASSSSSSQQQTEQGGYFFTPDNMDESLPLIARTKEFTDGSIPNPNSVSILNLLKLNAFTYRVEYKRKAHHILRLIQPALNAAPAYFSQSLLAIDFALSSGQLAIVLPSTEASEETEEQKAEMISALRRLYLPNVVIAIGREAVANEGTREEEVFVPPLLQGKTALNGRVTAYFCEGYTCKRPVQNGDELTQQLLEHKRAHRF
ncbi:Thioredoxin domain-containing protein, variant 2 [Balamuthia mandrillaris]